MADSVDGVVLIGLALGSETSLLSLTIRVLFIIRGSRLLKRHYGMLIPTVPARMNEALLAQGRYWYALPIESLILDRGTGSVTLEAPLHYIRECLRQPFPRAVEGKNESG